MPRRRKVTTKTKQSNMKKNVNYSSALNKDQLNVIKIILNAQNSDASSKKCLAELSKVYTSVSIIFSESYWILKNYLEL